MHFRTTTTVAFRTQSGLPRLSTKGVKDGVRIDVSSSPSPRIHRLKSFKMETYHSPSPASENKMEYDVAGRIGRNDSYDPDLESQPTRDELKRPLY